MKRVFHALCSALILLFLFPGIAQASEPPGEPMLRLETAFIPQESQEARQIGIIVIL
jgi:hypothetical protein